MGTQVQEVNIYDDDDVKRRVKNAEAAYGQYRSMMNKYNASNGQRTERETSVPASELDDFGWLGEMKNDFSQSKTRSNDYVYRSRRDGLRARHDQDDERIKKQLSLFSGPSSIVH